MAKSVTSYSVKQFSAKKTETEVEQPAMILNPLEWLRAEASGSQKESWKKFGTGLLVWAVAGLVVWWNQDSRAALTEKLGSTSLTVISWIGTLVGLGLFWGGGVLVFRTLTSRGLCQALLARCGSVNGLALAYAAALTLLTIVIHWLWSFVYAWMIAALVGLFLLSSAFGWKFPKRGKTDSVKAP